MSSSTRTNSPTTPKQNKPDVPQSVAALKKKDTLPEREPDDFDFSITIPKGSTIVILGPSDQVLHQTTIDATEMPLGIAVRHTWGLSSENATLYFLSQVPSTFIHVRNDGQTWYFRKVH